MRIIVCGGRDYDDYNTVADVLSVLDSGAILVNGDARGADRLAATVWEGWGLTAEAHHANWNKHGKAAGPIRNREMLAAGADLVIAFPGGDGTADMVAIAKDSGVTVLEVSS